MTIKGVTVDLVSVLYKPNKCTPETLLETILKQGFPAEIRRK